MSKTLKSKINGYVSVEIESGQVLLITSGDFRSNGTIYCKGTSRYGTYKNLLESMETVFEEDQSLYKTIYKLCHVKDNLIDPNTLKIKINNERVSNIDDEINDLQIRINELRNKKIILVHEALHAQTLFINTIRKERLKK
jgi:hypothetical protein